MDRVTVLLVICHIFVSGGWIQLLCYKIFVKSLSAEGGFSSYVISYLSYLRELMVDRVTVLQEMCHISVSGGWIELLCYKKFVISPSAESG